MALPLTALMDSSLAACIGRCVRRVEPALPADDIDRGLILRRLLEEEGFFLFAESDLRDRQEDRS